MPHLQVASSFETVKAMQVAFAIHMTTYTIRFHHDARHKTQVAIRMTLHGAWFSVTLVALNKVRMALGGRNTSYRADACSTPAPCSLYVPSMGGKDPNRQPRLRSLRDTAPGWIRLARCQACRHQGLLPVDALIRKWGDLHPIEFALLSLRCTECGARDVRHTMVRLCEPGCPRQRG